MKEVSGKIDACGTFMDQKILIVATTPFSQTLNDFDAYDSTIRHNNEAAGWSCYPTA